MIRNKIKGVLKIIEGGIFKIFIISYIILIIILGLFSWTSYSLGHLHVGDGPQFCGRLQFVVVFIHEFVINLRSASF